MIQGGNEPRSGAPSERQKPRGRRLRLPGMKVLPPPIRKRLRQSVIDVLRRDAPAPDYDHPVGDPGLFGPDTITWKIHADFPSMMAGGLGALMLQSLHPLALAGVWDHSNFRSDTLARLRGTIAFVARTSYAPRQAAEQAIERVRSVHRHVHGTAPDGRPYSADDPQLLTWVHCAEAWSFLRGYQTYCYGRVPRSAQDRYLHETARVAEALGALDVPKSVTELKAYFESMRPELVCDARTREVLVVLNSIRLPIPLPDLTRSLFMGAGAVLLPHWALDLIGLSRFERLHDRAAARTLKLIAPSIREAMAEGGLTWRACVRTGTDYTSLFFWRNGET
ncbi:MAG TPA: oxygenase MpaB family protein [Gammaproteobacteria bacterium]|nr:oxygenase MpaB family protein [Gammaproteobacteria bacterium]